MVPLEKYKILRKIKIRKIFCQLQHIIFCAKNSEGCYLSKKLVEKPCSIP